MPELRGVRVGPGRLCGHRIVHTHLPNSQTLRLTKKKDKDKSDATENGDNGIPGSQRL